jgi:hypothetical protein
MDRVISLLAALVGLIALGGAILVHVNGDAQRNQLAAEIDGLKATIGATPTAAAPARTGGLVSFAPAPTSSSSGPVVPMASEPPASGALDGASQIKALEERIAELERINAQQASELADARAQAAVASASSATTSTAASLAEVSTPAPLAPPPASSTPPATSAPASAETAAATDADCIPLGTRFMGKTGDSFPICKTKAVVKVAAVNDGSAVIAGAGPITAGSFADLTTTKGCTVMVFSADTTGYAEMRVTCE